MHVDVEVPVDAPPTAVWSVISDIEHSGETISSINSIEVLERPNEGLLGLKWRETRTLFGNSATETMWVTGVVEGASYTTEARSHGSVYRTDIRVDGAGDRSVLRMRFSADAISAGAKVMSVLMGWFMRRSVRGALLKDLQDVKAAAEARRLASPT